MALPYVWSGHTRPFFASCGIIIVDYFIKWVEAESIATISIEWIRRFYWKKIINGQEKSIHKIFLRDLRRRLEEAKGRWVEELSQVLWLTFEIDIVGAPKKKKSPLYMEHGKFMNLLQLMLVKFLPSREKIQRLISYGLTSVRGSGSTLHSPWSRDTRRGILEEDPSSLEKDHQKGPEWGLRSCGASSSYKSWLQHRRIQGPNTKPRGIPPPFVTHRQASQLEEKWQSLEERLRTIEGGDKYGLEAVDLYLVLDVGLPINFKTLEFDKYKGSSYPRVHLAMYC
ncbi:hypothetical protein CR513_15439, partial [Mucuna pruriens]